MFGLVEVDILSTFLQAILFGLYLASLALCLRWQILDDEGWRLRKNINWTMLIVVLLLFLFSTIDLSITLHMTITAIQGNLRYYQYPWVVNVVLELSSMLITDAVLIYRCWVVYAKSWRIVCFPIISWILFFISSFLGTFYFAALINPKNVESAFQATVTQHECFIILYCANIATNIYATSAIVLRILKVAKCNGNFNGSKRLHKISRILLESGILYTTTSVLTLVGYILENQLEFNLFGNSMAIFNFAATGITFNLILIRVGQDRSDLYDDSCTNIQHPKTGEVLSTLQFHHVSTLTTNLNSKPDRTEDDAESV